jgi:hypothetical protein
MNPLSLMGMLWSIGLACAEAMQDMDAAGNSVDEGQDYGDDIASAAVGLMAQTSLMIGLWIAGIDPSSPPAQEMKKAIEVITEDPVAVITALEIECRSNSDCLEGFVCVFSPGADGGTCIPIGDIGVRIAGVIDDKTCPYCRALIGRTGALDSMPIPPFHKYCRCWLEYLE